MPIRSNNITAKGIKKRRLREAALRINNFKEIFHTGSYWTEFIETKKRQEELQNYVIRSIIGQRRKAKWRQLRKELINIQRLRIAG